MCNQTWNRIQRNIILLDGEWMQLNPNLTSFEMGLRHKLKSVYEVVDEHLFILNVIKHGVCFEEVC
jgi:hypothetical protein